MFSPSLRDFFYGNLIFLLCQKHNKQLLFQLTHLHTCYKFLFFRFDYMARIFQDSLAIRHTLSLPTQENPL